MSAPFQAQLIALYRHGIRAFLQGLGQGLATIFIMVALAYLYRLLGIEGIVFLPTLLIFVLIRYCLTRKQLAKPLTRTLTELGQLVLWWGGVLIGYLMAATFFVALARFVVIK